MSITLKLPSQEEAWLRRRAARQGKDLDNFIYDLVQQEAQQEREREAAAKLSEGQSLAEALEGLIGVLDSSKKNGGQASHVAENIGNEFTSILVGETGGERGLSVKVTVLSSTEHRVSYRLDVYDSDVLIGEYERCNTAVHIKRKRQEVQCAAHVLRAVYAQHGSFTVRWVGEQDRRRKEIRASGDGRVLGHIPRECWGRA